MASYEVEDLTSIRKAMKCLFVQYANPGAYPPVLNVASILKEHGYTIHFLGTRNRFVEDLGIPATLSHDVKLLRQPENRSAKFFYLRFLVSVVLRGLVMRPDLLYVSDHMACPAARILGSLPRLKIVYHEHDSPNNTGSSKDRWLFQARDALAARADVCVLPNARRAEQLTKRVPKLKALRIVWNCPTIADIPSGAAVVRSDPHAPLVISYIGSLNEKRVPLSLADALALETRASLQLVGYETVGSVGFIDKFSNYAKTLGVGRRVNFLGPRSRNEIFSVLVQSHVALSLMPPSSDDINMSCMVGASNKSFDALACANPLIVSDLPEWRSAFVNAGLALPCDPANPQSIADQITWFCNHPEETLAMGMTGRRRVQEEWNYERQFTNVLPLLHPGKGRYL